MIGKFKDQIIKDSELPIHMTSYSPCFRKEGGSHGLEERGLYRVHQFEKQEMIVICEPEESMEWYEKMWKLTVEIFRNFDIPVRQLECCSGDLADLKVKSCDIEAWSPRQKKYFEVGSCSTLGDAQARRLGIRAKGEKGTYYLHTLNNTVVATPRGLIALIENNYQEDGSIKVPKALQPYMGGLKVKSCDVEAWSPRQQKYFEVGSCSTLGDAQARRLKIRTKGEKGNYLVHTLNNTVVATPRGLIAVVENNYQEDGSIKVPEVLWPYMGGTKVITPKN